MTGNELVSYLKGNKGKKVSCPVYFIDSLEWVFVERKDLIKTLIKMGNNESGCEFVDKGWYLELVRVD